MGASVWLCLAIHGDKQEPPVGALATWSDPSEKLKMEEIIAGLEGLTFAFEQDVELQKGTGLLPFQGMDKSSSAVCNFFAKGLCEKGMLCPLRHEKGKKMVVCKHWLRGLCRKADSCKFLHQYDVTRMPVCYFHSKFGNCSNKDCFFLHVQPTPKPQDCPWYNQGFCKDGPLCKYRHVHQVMCLNYFTGFCPKGPKCQLGHPKMSPVLYPSNAKLVNQPGDGTAPASSGNTLATPSLARFTVYHQKRPALPPACSSSFPPAP